MATQAGVQTFNTAFPFGISFQNQFQNEDLPIIYIVNAVNNNAAEQQLQVNISVDDDSIYSLKGFAFTPPTSPTNPSPSASATLAPSNSPFTPNASQYNFALAVRPGTLRAEVLQAFSETIYTAITASFNPATSNACAVNGPIIRNSDGALIWYVAFQNDISSSWSPVSSWEAVANNQSIQDICALNDGSLFGVGTDNKYYTQNDLSSGQWTKVNTSNTGYSVAMNPAGNFIIAGGGHQLYQVPAPPQSPGVLIPRSCCVTDITVLSDNSVLGVGTDNNFYHWPAGNAGPWTMITDATKIKKIAAFSNGGLIAIGVDNFLYQRDSWTSGQWTLLDNTVPLQGLGIRPDGSMLLFGIDNKLYQQTAAQNILSFTLNGISAAASTGTRGTQIETLFGNVFLNGLGNAMSFKRSEHIDIINHQGHSFAPLYFGVLGRNTLLNQAEYNNELSIYFETIDGNPIQLSQDATAPTKITFSFPYSNTNNKLMPFGNSSEVLAYQLNPTQQFPINTNKIGTDNGNGAIVIDANFTNLQSIQQGLTTSPVNAMASSLALYNQADASSAFSTQITSFNTNAKSLANFLTAPNAQFNEKGPITIFVEGAPSAYFSTTYKLGQGFMIPVNLNPTSANPSIPFDFVFWYTLTVVMYEQHKNYDILPAGMTSNYDYTNPWKDQGLLLYIVNNYHELVSELKSINPEMIGKIQLPSKAIVGGLIPCETLYEFFNTKYQEELYLANTEIESTSIGPNIAAADYLQYWISQQKQKAAATSLQLLNFLVSEEGPYYQLLNPRFNLENMESEDWLPLMFSPSSYTIKLASNNGSYQAFTIEKWNQKYQNALDTNSATNWDTLPAGIDCNYTPSTAWTDPKFYTYVSDNISELMHQMLAVVFGNTLNSQSDSAYQQSPKLQDYMQNLSTQNISFIPCGALYAFFYTQYQLSQSLKVSLSNFMLDTATPFSATNWDNTFDEACQLIPNGYAILSQSAVNANAQEFTDTGFTSYLTANFSSLVGDLSPISYQNTSYLIPSQSLYDYLMAAYQKTLSPPTPKTNTQLTNVSSYVFQFSDVQVSGMDGIVNVGINVENLPGYWDTQFQLPVHKSKTIVDPTIKLGRSEEAGRSRILPTDPNYTNANGLNPGSRIDFLSAGLKGGKPNVSLEEHYGLNIYGTLPAARTASPAGLPTEEGEDSTIGQPVRVKDADLLLEDGRLGIGNVPQGDLSGDFSDPQSGLSNPNEKLRVNGDSYLEGGLGVSGDTAVVGNFSGAGNATFQGNLNIQGNFTAHGSIQDQYGSLIPVGTLAQRIYLFENNHPTPPAGWLVCDGSSIFNYLFEPGPNDYPILKTAFVPLYLFLLKNGTVPFPNNTKVPINSSLTIKQGEGQSNNFYFYDPTTSQLSVNRIPKISLPQLTFNTQNAEGGNCAIQFGPQHCPDGVSFPNGVNNHNTQIVYLIKY